MAEISYPLEPFKIKTVERIPITSREEREKILEDARGNIFRVPARAITIDLLTDSGTGAMSDAQWGALMQGDESYAGSKSWEILDGTAQEVFGMPWILPAHQGRGAEHLLFTVMLERKGEPVIPGERAFRHNERAYPVGGRNWGRLHRALGGRSRFGLPVQGRYRPAAAEGGDRGGRGREGAACPDHAHGEYGGGPTGEHEVPEGCPEDLR